MPQDDTQLDGQEVVVDDETPETPGTNGGAGDEGWFLDLGDGRTRYKTQDEAIKGFKNASQRIAGLSEWEKAARQYGIGDAKVLPTLFDELIELRKGAKKDSGTNKGADGAGELSADEQKARAWLAKSLGELGYVPKSELDKVIGKLQQLEAGQSQSRSTFEDQRINEGRTVLRGLLSEAKLPTDPKFLKFIENNLVPYFEEDQERLATFFKGGDEAAALIKQAFEETRATLGLLNPGKQQGSGPGSYQKKKETVVQNTARPLPNSGAGKPAPPAKKEPEGFTPDTHNKAWEVLQRVLHGGDDQ